MTKLSKRGITWDFLTTPFPAKMVVAAFKTVIQLYCTEKSLILVYFIWNIIVLHQYIPNLEHRYSEGYILVALKKALLRYDIFVYLLILKENLSGLTLGFLVQLNMMLWCDFSPFFIHLGWSTKIYQPKTIEILVYWNHGFSSQFAFGPDSKILDY